MGRNLLRLPEKPVEGFIHGYSLLWALVELADAHTETISRVYVPHLTPPPPPT